MDYKVIKKNQKLNWNSFPFKKNHLNVYKTTSSQTGEIWTVMEKWYSYSFNFKALSALASEQ